MRRYQKLLAVAFFTIAIPAHAANPKAFELAPFVTTSVLSSAAGTGKGFEAGLELNAQLKKMTFRTSTPWDLLFLPLAFIFDTMTFSVATGIYDAPTVLDKKTNLRMLYDIRLLLGKSLQRNDTDTIDCSFGVGGGVFEVGTTANTKRDTIDFFHPIVRLTDSHKLSELQTVRLGLEYRYLKMNSEVRDSSLTRRNHALDNMSVYSIIGQYALGL